MSFSSPLPRKTRLQVHTSHIGNHTKWTVRGHMCHVIIVFSFAHTVETDAYQNSNSRERRASTRTKLGRPLGQVARTSIHLRSSAATEKHT